MGLITTYGRVPYLLASIVTLGICHGLHVYLMGGAIMPLPASANPLRVDLFAHHPELVSLAAIGVVVAIGLVFFLRTQLGICLSVYGVNPHFFAFHGINTTFVAISGLVLTNALAGVSGYLVAQSSGFIDMNAGQGLSLFCVTALVMGNLLLKKVNAFSSYIPFLGITAYCMLQQALLHVGFNLKYFIAVQALIVLGVVVSQRSGSDINTIHSDHLGV
jgi:putative ABC transport system permease protein